MSPGKRSEPIRRIVLFSMECFASGAAIQRFVERHRDVLELVVTTDSRRHGGSLRQIAHLPRSGARFLCYLALNFRFYAWAVRAVRWWSRMTGRPRRSFLVGELCGRFGIRHFEAIDVNAPEVLEVLRGARPDLILVYYFDQIVRQPLIRIPRLGVINAHEACLPRCRGLFPVLFSAAHNGGRFGVTVHRIEDRSIDAGPILAQAQIPVPPGKSILGIDRLVNAEGVELVSRVLESFDRLGRGTPQGEGTYYSYPTRADIRKARRRGYPLCSLADYLEGLIGGSAGGKR